MGVKPYTAHLFLMPRPPPRLSPSLTVFPNHNNRWPRNRRRRSPQITSTMSTTRTTSLPCPFSLPPFARDRDQLGHPVLLVQCVYGLMRPWCVIDLTVAALPLSRSVFCQDDDVDATFIGAVELGSSFSGVSEDRQLRGIGRHTCTKLQLLGPHRTKFRSSLGGFKTRS